MPSSVRRAWAVFAMARNATNQHSASSGTAAVRGISATVARSRSTVVRRLAMSVRVCTRPRARSWVAATAAPTWSSRSRPNVSGSA